LIPILGDALFIAAFAGFCVFFFSYLIFSDWKSSPVGQNLLAFMGVCGLVLASRFLRLVLGDPLWDRVRDHVSVVDYLLVNIVVWWRVVLLLKTQRASRHEAETGPGAVEAGGLERGRIKNQRLFQFNGMAPAIAEIVEIKKTPARPVVEIPQPDFRFVEEPAVVVGLRLADLLVSPVGQAADPEFMQMGPVTT